MRIALLSDIHANLEALNACIAHARDNGAARFAFLGDFVGYGADAQAVVAIVARHVAEGAVAVKGNHDEAVEDASSYFNDAARAAIDWARETLTEEQRRFLAALPLIVREEDICFVHASAAAPARWDYIDSPAEARHASTPPTRTTRFAATCTTSCCISRRARGGCANSGRCPGRRFPCAAIGAGWPSSGTVGQPRDRNPAAAYTLFDPERREMTFFRVAYDAGAAAGKIRKCGLPESLAYRVELGI